MTSQQGLSSSTSSEETVDGKSDGPLVGLAVAASAALHKPLSLETRKGTITSGQSSGQQDSHLSSQQGSSASGRKHPGLMGCGST